MTTTATVEAVEVGAKQSRAVALLSDDNVFKMAALIGRALCCPVSSAVTQR